MTQRQAGRGGGAGGRRGWVLRSAFCTELVAQNMLSAPPTVRPAAPPASSRQPNRSALEHRALTRLLQAAPPVPNLMTAPLSRSEQRRRRLLLQAQNELTETWLWAREAFTPAPAPGAAAAAAAEIRAKLGEWNTRGQEQMAAEAEAHASAVRDVREGSKQLSEDLRHLKRAAVVGTEEVKRVKRGREAAHPSVKLLPASPALVATRAACARAGVASAPSRERCASL
jgi:hypothetical protein